MIPSLVGRMPLGKSESHPLAETGGSETVTLTTAQMPSHNHSVSVSILENGEHSHTIRSGTGSGITKALNTLYNITENSSVAPSGIHTHSTSISE